MWWATFLATCGVICRATYVLLWKHYNGTIIDSILLWPFTTDIFHYISQSVPFCPYHSIPLIIWLVCHKLGSLKALSNSVYSNGGSSINFLARDVIYTQWFIITGTVWKVNILVAWPHLWLKLGMVKPEIMLCEMVLNLSMLRYVTAQYPVTWRHVIGLVRQLNCLKLRLQISFLLGPGCKSSRLQSVVCNAEGL